MLVKKPESVEEAIETAILLENDSRELWVHVYQRVAPKIEQIMMERVYSEMLVAEIIALMHLLMPKLPGTKVMDFIDWLVSEKKLKYTNKRRSVALA